MLTFDNTKGFTHRFRSPEEFAPHAEWLAHGCPLKKNGSPTCGCCYCSGKRQGKISKALKECVGNLFSNSFEPSESRVLQGPSRTRRTSARGDGPTARRIIRKSVKQGRSRLGLRTRANNRSISFIS